MFCFLFWWHLLEGFWISLESLYAFAIYCMCFISCLKNHIFSSLTLNKTYKIFTLAALASVFTSLALRLISTAPPCLSLGIFNGLLYFRAWCLSRTDLLSLPWVYYVYLNRARWIGENALMPVAWRNEEMKMELQRFPTLVDSEQPGVQKQWHFPPPCPCHPGCLKKRWASNGLSLSLDSKTPVPSRPFVKSAFQALAKCFIVTSD